MKVCEHSGSKTGGIIQRLRVERFSRVMQIHMEYPCTGVWLGRASWGEMLLPRFLVWDKVCYEFLAMIVQDKTKGVDHFRSVMKIEGKLYKHGERETMPAGRIRLIDTTANQTEDVSISTLLSAKYNERPCRFYYVRVGNEYG
jgi:hypothetical protein